MTTRLQTLKNYLVMAQLEPNANKLYIEDLKLSIEYEMSQQPVENKIELQKGFVDRKDDDVYTL